MTSQVTFELVEKEKRIKMRWMNEMTMQLISRNELIFLSRRISICCQFKKKRQKQTNQFQSRKLQTTWTHAYNSIQQNCELNAVMNEIFSQWWHHFSFWSRWLPNNGLFNSIFNKRIQIWYFVQFMRHNCTINFTMLCICPRPENWCCRTHAMHAIDAGRQRTSRVNTIRRIRKNQNDLSRSECSGEKKIYSMKRE